MRDHRLTVAEWLLEAGAGRSAIAVLGDLLGQQANELRRLAKDATLARRTVFALVALDPDRGAAVPLLPSPGRSRARDPELRLACDRALEAARRILGAPSLPALRFELEEWLSLFGASIGLPALLAFVGYYAPSRMPAAAVLATGRLVDGALAAVDGMDAKRAIAEEERGEKLIVTAHVGSLEAAVATVFGPAPLVPERHVLTLDQTIECARQETDRAKALAELEALPLDAMAESDRARVLLELGTLCRHIGESDRAALLHDQARELLDAQRRFIGAEAAERYELECWLSAMDEFRIDQAIDALSSRLQAPFLTAHNEVRCRGMLAQALGMAGRHAGAALVRSANLELQQASDALRSVLPGTYCYLALDSAKAGDRAGFERWSSALADTPKGNDTQWRFNAAAIVRGLVALERYDEAIAWAEANTRLLLDDRPIASHPETSLLRALARAFKRRGDPQRALQLAERVPISEPNLIGWLSALVHLEANPTPELQAKLTELHAAATDFHRDLVTAQGAELENAIDRVWY